MATQPEVLEPGASGGSVNYQHVQAFLTTLHNTCNQVWVSDATIKGYFQVLQGFFKVV